MKPETSQTHPTAGEVTIERVIGRRLPSVALTHNVCGIDLSKLRTGLVIYTFPGCPCSPLEGYRSPREDVAQHEAFAQLLHEFGDCHCEVVGISSQDAALQREVDMWPLLLCDPQLHFAHQLELPTFHADGSEWYHRSILIAADGGRVAHTIYPVPSAGQSAAQALQWLRTQRGQPWRV